MELHASDEAFVRARRRDVHAYLVDVAGYGSWWPGARRIPGGEGIRFRLAAGALRRHELELRLAGVRRDLGVEFDVAGAVVGEAEWYYLDERDGVRVHWLLRAGAPARGARRRLEAHRAAIRRGLGALKDLLESGRAVGEEPSARLLADQEAARRPWTDARPGAPHPG